MHFSAVRYFIQFLPLEMDFEGFHDMANITKGAYELAKAGG